MILGIAVANDHLADHIHGLARTVRERLATQQVGDDDCREDVACAMKLTGYLFVLVEEIGLCVSIEAADAVLAVDDAAGDECRARADGYQTVEVGKVCASGSWPPYSWGR